MARKLGIVGAVLGTGALVVAAVVVALAQPNLTTPTSITVIEHATTDKFVDVGKPGVSSGDLLTFHNKVYDETDTTVAGTSQGSCVLLVPKKGLWQCAWTTSLADGQITVRGPFVEGEESVLAVTGGTGLYSNARGSMGLSCDFEAVTCTFAFELIP